MFAVTPLWAVNFLTNNYCNTFKHVLCIVLYQPRRKTVKNIITDIIGAICLFGSFYVALIIGHAFGL